MKQIELIPLDKLGPSLISQRTNFDESSLEDLVSSIRKFGVLEPIIINDINGVYTIISGTRRAMACDILKIPAVPAIIITASAEDVEIIKLHENLFREELNIIDEAKSLSVLELTFHLSREKIAELMGKSKGWVTQRLDILTWPSELILALKSKEISFSVARELSRIPDPAELDRLLLCCIEGGATVRVVTGWVAEVLARQPVKPLVIVSDLNKDITDSMKKILEGPCFTCEDDHPERIHLIGVCPNCLEALKSINKPENIEGRETVT